MQIVPQHTTQRSLVSSIWATQFNFHLMKNIYIPCIRTIPCFCNICNSNLHILVLKPKALIFRAILKCIEYFYLCFFHFLTFKRIAQFFFFYINSQVPALQKCWEKVPFYLILFWVRSLFKFCIQCKWNKLNGARY